MSPWYRVGDPGHDASAHLNFGRRQKTIPRQCRGDALPGDNLALSKKCLRPSVALCDFVVAHDDADVAVTCDMPLCEHHRTAVGPDVDYCPRHARLAAKAAG
jgi:hypothetical protein